MENAGRLSVHPAQEFFVESLGCLVFIHAHAVEYKRQPHDIVVTVALCKDDIALLHHLHGALQMVAEMHTYRVTILVDSTLWSLHLDEVSVFVDTQLLTGQTDVACVGAEDHHGVVAKAHHAVDVLALLIHLVAAPYGVDIRDVHIGAGVDLLRTFRVVGHVDLYPLGQYKGHYDVIAQS